MTPGPGQVNTDQETRGQQDPRQAPQARRGMRQTGEPGAAVPAGVRPQGPEAHQDHHQDQALGQGVQGTKAEQDPGDGIAKTGRGQVFRHQGGQTTGGCLGRVHHQQRDPQGHQDRDQAHQQADSPARPGGACIPRQAFGGAQEQESGQPATQGGGGEGHVGGRQAHPDQRGQEAEEGEAQGGAERGGGDQHPQGQAQDQRGQQAIQDQGQTGHDGPRNPGSADRGGR